VDIYHLTNDDGIRVSILTFGGIIVTLEVPDRTGRLANVVLGLASLDSYARVSPHFGAVVGRFANRIVGGRFAIDGTTYQLEINNGPNAQALRMLIEGCVMVTRARGAAWPVRHIDVPGAPKEAACVTPSKGLDGSRITRLSATARRRR
jgi:Aldose 1-epimerase